LSSAGVAETQPGSANHSETTPSGIEIYEHRTDQGELHTIVLPPQGITGTTAGDDVLGIVVIPERGRVCQAVAGKGYEAADAGCTKDESRVDAYLDAAAVERSSNGNYTVG
jgi:hypothetical protein